MARLPRVAIVCSAHGFGHLTRELAVAAALRERGVDPVIVTASPALVAERLPGARVVHRAVDVGILQPDSLHEDPVGTAAAAAERCTEAAVADLVALLRGFDRVVVDVAPVALEAARRAGVRTLAVGNFDWAWIYRHYPALHPLAERFAAWQAPHPALELAPGPGMQGFASVVRLGLLGQGAPPVRPPVPGRAVLVALGGFGQGDLDRLLPVVPGVTWITTPPLPPLSRPDVRHVDGIPFPRLVGGVDAVFTKPGYGILAETALAGTPVVWARRGGFPEAPYLEAWFAARGDLPVAASPDDPPAFRAALAETLVARLACPRPEAVAADGAAQVAARVMA